MRKSEHAVALTDDQRAALEERFAGALTLRQRNRIQVLLRADAGEPDAGIADGLGLSAGAAANVRKRFAADGLEAALTETPRKGGPAVLDGKGEAVVIALACRPVPGGPAVWAAGMPASRLVGRTEVESVSEDTILRALKRTRSTLGGRRGGASRRG